MNEFLMELRNLLEKYDYALGVDIRGDTFGVKYDFVVIEKNGLSKVVNNYDSRLTVYDIDAYLNDE